MDLYLCSSFERLLRMFTCLSLEDTGLAHEDKLQLDPNRPESAMLIII